jgi:hypothetical protein
LYRAIVTHVHDGENYYDAAGRELRSQGYPTASCFNWRTPVYAWLIGSLPNPEWARVIVILGALATLFLSYGLMLQESNRMWMGAAATLLLLGAVNWCVDGDAFLVQELWAGVLIALSVALYGHDRWCAGTLTGLLALFLRELALPYCVIAMALAAWQRRYRELVLWVVGFALYAEFLLWHFAEATRHMTLQDRAPGDWVQFGGVPFLLVTVQINAFLFPLPQWISAVYLPLSLLGLIGWRGRTAGRVGLTIAAYLAAFAVAGQPFNNYWGLLYAPLLPFGLAWAPVALRDLAVALLRPTPLPVKTAHVS